MKLPKAYESGQYESDIYSLWEQSRAFEPQDSKESFSLVVPPPNANAPLHIGFGLTMVIEDIIARYNRMKGKSTLFVPGADHAGFETWVVYEKWLASEGKSRFDYSREELYKQVWDFVVSNRSVFEKQFRQLGASVDWNHFTFTLDDKVVKKVYKTFKQMWDDNLIYRGERLVNFCTHHGTSFADIEVEYKQENSKLVFINYPLTDSSGQITVATTRPETMLGDSAVAVNPIDKRYKNYIGKTVKLPLTKREIPVIADEMVDIKFGTGAVKITPAHDFNDFAVGERHDLPKITVVDCEGRMSHEAPEDYRGLTIEKARDQVVKDLKEQGLLAKEESCVHNVGHCYKCGTVIEPLLRKQWFIDMKPLAKPAIKALKDNKIKFYPQSKKALLIRYLEGLKDWNISRQIAWGIPIPAFFNTQDSDDWIFNTRVGEETITVNGKTYTRDPDVFDTWFSSGSWPYSTLDYPSDLSKKYYPLSVMETGGEILYPWVSRMLMLGLYVTGEVPFKSVYIHGYVMAEDGSKMSKSVGNTIDLTGVIDKYGSDAFRMGIIAGRTAAVNRGYDKSKIEGARNFANKIWNIARFSESVLGDAFKLKSPRADSMADHWILDRLQKCTEGTIKDLDAYNISPAYDRLYHFVWDDIADWYVEASKVGSNNQLLAYVLISLLKLIHPFAPYVSETIWQTMYWTGDSLLINQQIPKCLKYNSSKASQFKEIQKIVSEIRYITKALDVKLPSLYFNNQSFLQENSDLIKKLANLKNVTEVESGRGMRLIQTKLDCWLDIDLDTAKKYITKLHTNKLEHETAIDRLDKRLKNKAYTSKAPKEVVRQTKDQIKEEQQLLEKINQEINNFESATQNM